MSSFSEALLQKNAAVFIGSGISAKTESSSPWKSLITPLMKDPLGIEGIDVCDLPLIAQFIANELGETAFHGKIEQFTECETAPNEIHRILHNMPLDVMWTTNYDRVIEEAYQSFSPTKKIDHKYEAEAIHRYKPDHISLYKMHGDIDHRRTIVITKRHYDNYHIKNSLFINHLNYHLTKRVFLFIGFGFTDPNVNHILSRLKKMSEGENSKHFLILLSKETKDAEIIARDLWAKELRQNFGIETVLIKDRKDLVRILQNVVNNVILRNIVLCGSCENDSYENLCKGIGRMLMEDASHAYNLYTCFAKGVGRSAIGGALEHFAETLPTDTLPYEKVRIWPVNKELSGITDEKLKIFREGMISDAGACIFVKGKEGTEIEWKIAKEKGKFCIPLGFTGGTAKKVWKDVCKNTDNYLKSYNLSKLHKAEIKKIIEELGETDKDEFIVNHVRRILSLLSGESAIDNC